MANENKDIGEIVKKCKILLLDIEGTTTSISFVKDKLFPYAEQNVKQYLEKQWETDEVKEAVTALRKLALEDQENKVEGLVAIPGEDASKDDQIEGLVKNVKWQMSADRKSGALKLLQGLIWKGGYDNGDIKGHVYDDVSSALEHWQSVEGQKVYIYSSGSVQAQKLLFGQSSSGDLLKYIEGHFDTAVGAKQEAASYTAIVEKIGCKADEVLFLTDIVKEAEAARAAGVQAALATRPGNEELPAAAAADYPVIHTLAQLRTNKRKTDPQDEQPAKVPKIDIEKDVKSTVETETAKEETKVAEKAKEEPEKMETDEEPPVKEDEKKEKVETISIKEVTDSKNVEGTEVEMEPIVTEVEDSKPEKTEQMETESTDKVDESQKAVPEPEKENPKPVESTDLNKKTEENTVVPKENNEAKVMDTSAPAAEEAATVVTEIEEITSDKENLSEMAEIIENLEPVVEEPGAAEDAEELRNVGDVLEKECDEILSKVQGVTNLDNIPLRPLLNPIEEETLEAENTNDIVDSILDTELEIEMKKSEDIATTTAKVKHPEKSPNVEDKSKEKNSVPEETVIESDVKIEITPEQTPTENNTAEKEKVDNEEKQELKDKTEDASVIEKSNDKIEVIDKEAKEDKPKEEVQVNGKATNGETVVENGDSSKEEELSSRLSVENGKEVNSNGDAKKNGEGDKAEKEVSDIKVKTVSTEEPRTDLIEQPTEA